MSGFEIEGFEDLEEYIQNMTLTDSDKRKALKSAMQPIAEEVEKNTPIRTGELKKSIKVQVKKEELAVVGIVKMGKFYDAFQEFGTSQQKAHVGFFEKSVNKTQNKAIEILTDELLNKAK
ncbi:HK97 gp10 family phage protein [Clostridium pasteurianum]|uniref:HK97-gp10 family putative phage morphogenesis protein n=1 Tax=Clostridium pasteurianum TaxID=1501 RepID=UPI002260F63A|nr:HK97-gp10 family putative phage morphogenesis protein [Clostridium pasteurianum]UZW13195.1 HK97 gp10 family phage protein [Clostridium pasteurianum]